jgi:predicted nucleic acid-binding protein
MVMVDTGFWLALANKKMSIMKKPSRRWIWQMLRW